MAPQKMTEYERRRLENIKRNDQMMASLNIHSRLSELSATSKRHREEKSYKLSSEKKPKPEDPVVIRRSLRTQGMSPDSSGLSPDFNDSVVKTSKSKSSLSPPKPSPVVLGPISMKDAHHGDGSGRALIDAIMSVSSKSELGGEKGGLSDGNLRNLRSSSNKNAEGGDFNNNIKVRGLVDLTSLSLEPQNIARIVPGKILVVRFFPTNDMTMIVVGNKYGNVGFWNVKAENEDGDGIYLYQPHSAPVSGFSIQPFSMTKVYTSSYDGILRLMDVEKEVFDILCSNDSAIFSLSQRPDDTKSIYFSDGPGTVNMCDDREGEIVSSWSLHEERINSIDFCSANSNIMATSSTDGSASIWDLRKMGLKPKALQTLNHGRAVRSAYFSPSGSCLATTSLDDNIGVLSGANFEDVVMIPHDNWTNRWIASFRAVWGWDDSYLYVGNMKRRVDVISVAQKKQIYALQSPLMSAIPCRYDAHPCQIGTLAGATSGGQVYIWTSPQ